MHGPSGGAQRGSTAGEHAHTDTAGEHSGGARAYREAERTNAQWRNQEETRGSTAGEPSGGAQQGSTAGETMRILRPREHFDLKAFFRQRKNPLSASAVWGMNSS